MPVSGPISRSAELAYRNLTFLITFVDRYKYYLIQKYAQKFNNFSLFFPQPKCFAFFCFFLFFYIQKETCSVYPLVFVIVMTCHGHFFFLLLEIVPRPNRDQQWQHLMLTVWWRK